MTLIVLLTLPIIASGQTDSWTHFRGDKLNGIAGEGTYPVNWNDTSNIEWIFEARGRGWSSPVVLGQQVWITSATAGGDRMFACCIDLETGEKMYEIDLFAPDTVYRRHAVNSYATPTPAIEEGYVYVHFGRYGTACIDTRTGEKVWERTDIECAHVQGPGSSLFLYEDKLIVHMEGTDVQEIYALDKHTGETIWMASRDQVFYDPLADIGKKAYVTPIVVEVDGRKLLVSNGSAVCNAFDIETGEVVWYIPQGEDSTISMPVTYNGMLYFYTSFVTPDEGEKYCELWAVDPEGEGNLTENIQWRMQFPILQLLTPVIHDGLLYTIDTRSDMYCIDVTTGETVWQQKMKGKFNASPIWADGNIYVTSTRGDTYVIEAGMKYNPVAVNSLPGEVWSTPAFVGGNILMRTSKGLFKISFRDQITAVYAE